MSGNLPAPPSGGWFVEWITNGKLPGAARAITQLIGDAANAGSAWINIATAKGQQLQERIRSETSGSRVVMEAMAVEAAKMGATDPKIVEAALQQFGSTLIKKHLNKVAVVRETTEQMNSEKPTEESPGDIEDDWMNRFEPLAEGASTERMQKILGKVLAGEIRHPGTYSFATLNFINLIDTKVGNAINSVAPYVIQGEMIPFPDRFDFMAMFGELLILKEYGVVGENLRRRCAIAENTGMFLRADNFGIIVKEPNSPDFFLSYIPLTRVGREVFSLLNAKSTVDHMEELAGEALIKIPCKTVDVLKITRLEDQSENFELLYQKTL